MKHRAMKVVLRNEEKGLYYRAPVKWVSEPAHAHDFQGTGQALRAARDLGLHNVQVALTFGDPHHDVVLPLHP